MMATVTTFKATTKDGRGYHGVPDSEATSFLVMKASPSGLTLDMVAEFDTRNEAEDYLKSMEEK